MVQLRIDVIGTLDDRCLAVNLPDDVALGQLVLALVRRLGLSEGEAGAGGREDQRPLAAGVTLAGAMIGLQLPAQTWLGRRNRAGMRNPASSTR